MTTATAKMLIPLSLVVFAVLFLTSCAPGSSLDRMRHKEVKVSFRRILVNKYTDRVAYYWSDGRWKKLEPSAQSTMQALYEAQKASD